MYIKHKFRHLQPPAQRTLFEVTPLTALARFIDYALDLIEREPSILNLVQADMDRHGATKKADRLRDHHWEHEKQDRLPELSVQVTALDPAQLKLRTGRPLKPIRSGAPLLFRKKRDVETRALPLFCQMLVKRGGAPVPIPQNMAVLSGALVAFPQLFRINPRVHPG